MTVAASHKPLSRLALPIILSILFAGACWYISDGLTGDYFYLMWFAPAPILLLTFNVNRKLAFAISFLAYLIGRLSWFSYLVTVATLVPAIIFTLLLPVIFALIVLLTREIVIKSSHWSSVFAFPVLFTSFEFLILSFSPDGSAASIAYSQSNFLTLIQLGSLTGILGITFVITFIPSVIALAWHYRTQKNAFIKTIVAGLIVVIPIFIFGIVRLHNVPVHTQITVGLAVAEEKLHNMSDHPDFAKETQLAEAYAKTIDTLAAQHAMFIVLPERALNINKDNSAHILGILSNAAKHNQVFLIVGYTNFKESTERNSAIVINEEGLIISDYNKAHLVTGLERQFTPGKEIGLFQSRNSIAGVAICKDLDYPEYLRKYGEKGVNILYVPAWDFIQDGWLHSRMAVLRGVENGFNQVRSARQGRLTISDAYGRINAEASSAANNVSTLIGNIDSNSSKTFYTRFGNWFAILITIAAGGFILRLILKHKSLQNRLD